MRRTRATATISELIHRASAESPRTGFGRPDSSAAPLLPPPLFDLRDRLSAAFSLDELQELAFSLGIEADTLPGDRRGTFALALARAGWCRGLLDGLLAEAARLRPRADWVWDAAALPAPPHEGCEDDPLPRPTVFSDWRQVVAFMVLLLLASAGVFGAWKLASRPREMTGAFNVAVAGVQVVAAEPGAPVAGVGQRLQREVVTLLDRELTELGATGVQVSGARMPVVADDADAAALSRQVDAHLVVRGEAWVDRNGVVDFLPVYYVNLPANTHGDLSELNGGHALNAPLRIPPGAPDGWPPPTGQTAEGAAVLARFAQALVYLAADDLPAARETVEAAADLSEAYAEQYGEFEGRAVIYLFASHIARLQATAARTTDPAGAAAHLRRAAAHADTTRALRPDYDRAHIALANIYFETPGQMGEAFRAYEAALRLAQEAEVDTAFVAQKAHLGLGNVLLVRLHELSAAGVEVAEMEPLAAEALAHFAAAAALPTQPAELQRTLAGEALANSGHVHALMGNGGAATAAFCAAQAYPLRPTPAAGVDDALAADGRSQVCGEE